MKWMEASRDITTALLSSAEPHRRPLQLIAESACALTDAEQAIVLVPADPDLPVDEVDTLVVSAAVGLMPPRSLANGSRWRAPPVAVFSAPANR